MRFVISTPLCGGEILLFYYEIRKISRRFPKGLRTPRNDIVSNFLRLPYTLLHNSSTPILHFSIMPIGNQLSIFYLLLYINRFNYLCVMLPEPIILLRVISCKVQSPALASLECRSNYKSGYCSDIAQFQKFWRNFCSSIEIFYFTYQEF